MTPFGIALIARGQASAPMVFLLESGDDLLLESGDKLLLESDGGSAFTGTVAVTEDEDTSVANGAVGLVVGNAQNATVTAAGTTGITVTKPTDVITGDVMYAFISRTTFANNAAWTCSGWTDIGPAAASAGSTVGNDRQMTMLRKVVTDGAGEAANYTFVNTQSTTYQIVGIIINVHGASTTTPEDAAIPAYNFNSDDATPASRNVTSVTAGALVIQFCQLSLGTTAPVTPGAPSTYTLVPNGNASETAGGVTDNQCVTAYKFLGAASSTAGTNVWTHTPDDATTETLIACVAVRDVASVATITGTLAVTEEEETLAASGTAHESITGTVAVTEDDETVVGAGTFTTAITGTVAVTEEQDTIAGTAEHSGRWKRRSRIVKITPSRLRPRSLATYGIAGVANFVGVGNVTEEEDTLAATGAVTIIGTADLVEENDTLVAAAAHTVTGSVAVTEGEDVAVGAGNQPTTGTADLTEEEDTSFSSQGASGAAGSAAITEEEEVVAAHGAGMGLVLVARNVAVPTLVDVPRVFSWVLRQRLVVNVSGAAAIVEEADTLTADGNQSVPGSAAFVEEDDTAAAEGTFTLMTRTGTVAVTEELDTLAAEGAQPVEALAFLIEEEDTAAATGTHTLAEITGTTFVTEENETLVASGTSTPPLITGTAAVTEEGDTLVADGTFTLMTRTGTVAVTEELDTMVASGDQSVPGTVAVVEEDDTVAATGTFTVTGTATIVEEADATTATGYLVIFGAVVMVEDDDATTASGTAVALVVGVALITEEADVLITALAILTFEPPHDEQGPRKLSEHGRRRQGVSRKANELAGRYGAPRSFSVLKIDGVYVTIEGPTMDQVNAATEYYAGGHIHEVTATQAAALEAAGYEVAGYP